MSVQETQVIAVDDALEGVAIGERLAARCRASLRWAALWTSRSVATELGARLGGRLVQTRDDEGLGFEMLCVATPTPEDVRHFVAVAGSDPVCVHWSPRLYVSDGGDDAPWISFVDGEGRTRDDARVYRIELAGNAEPLSTMGDRPSDEDLRLGPRPGTGWRLALTTIRDHMARARLAAWIAHAAALPAARVLYAESFTRRPPTR